MRAMPTVFTAMTCLLAAPAVRAQSLMDAAPDERVAPEGASYSPFGAPRKEPFKRNDHLTVIIRERTRASVNSELRTDHRTRIDSTLPNIPHLQGGGKGLPSAEATSPGLALNMDDRYRQDNTAGTQREGSVEDTVQAIVVDVKENGDLVVEGMKERGVNGETECIRVSGIVSPQFVSADRTVRAERIAHLQVFYTGDGTVGDKSEPGFFGKVLGKLWPF